MINEAIRKVLSRSYICIEVILNINFAILIFSIKYFILFYTDLSTHMEKNPKSKRDVVIIGLILKIVCEHSPSPSANYRNHSQTCRKNKSKFQNPAVRFI